MPPLPPLKSWLVYTSTILLLFGVIIYHQMPIAYAQTGDSDEPTTALGFIERGQASMAAGNYQNAIDDFSLAIDLEPANDQAYTLRGDAYRLLERYPLAITDLNRAILLNEENGQALAIRGTIRLEQDRLEQALSDLDQAISLNEDYTFAYFIRSVAHQQAGNDAEAEADIVRFMELYAFSILTEPAPAPVTSLTSNALTTGLTSIAAPTPTPTTQLASVATATPTPTRRALRLPTRTPTATATPESRQPNAVAVINTDNLNVRTGPGTDYPAIGKLAQGVSVPVTGRAKDDDSCGWVQIQYSDDESGWISAQARFSSLQGECQDLREITVAPPPTPAFSGGCFLVVNEMDVELNLTFTKADGTPDKNFQVPGKQSKRECFDPGKYTVSVDAPPPWGGFNTEVEVVRGVVVRWPIRGG